MKGVKKNLQERNTSPGHQSPHRTDSTAVKTRVYAERTNRR